ncbi:Translation factor [Apiospora phragmitis]|uniref:Translation factor n=1 Tax=Apiospora phragmitis TaxID=2905665 RepID=A0ABR1VRA8_9PEZI
MSDRTRSRAKPSSYVHGATIRPTICPIRWFFLYANSSLPGENSTKAKALTSVTSDTRRPGEAASYALACITMTDDTLLAIQNAVGVDGPGSGLAVWPLHWPLGYISEARNGQLGRDNRSSNRRPEETERALVLDEFPEGMVQAGPARIETRIVRRAHVLSTPPSRASDHEDSQPTPATDAEARRREEGRASAAQTTLPRSRATDFSQGHRTFSPTLHFVHAAPADSSKTACTYGFYMPAYPTMGRCLDDVCPSNDLELWSSSDPEGDLPDPPAWTTPHFSVRTSAMGCPRCATSSWRHPAVLEPRLRPSPTLPSPYALGFVLAGHQRGMAVTAQTGSMIYPHLVEALGHVDVRTEVTESFASRGGAVLLRFEILPVIHEIDLSAADILCVLNRLEATSRPGSTTAIGVGPKTGLNVQSLVPLVGNIPTLKGDHIKPLRRLLKTQNAKIGHAFTTVGSENMVAPFPGFEELKLKVFATAFPTDSDDYRRLAGLAGLCSPTGFLGSLCPSVFPGLPASRARGQYHHRARGLDEGGLEGRYRNHRTRGDGCYEPYVLATVTVHKEYLDRVLELCEVNRGKQESVEFFHSMSVIIKYRLPTAQLAAGRKRAGLVKPPLLVNKEPVDAISRVVYKSQAERLGRQETGFDDRILDVLVAGVEDPPYAEVLAAVLVARAGRAGELDIAAADAGAAAPTRKTFLPSFGQEQRHGMRLEHGGGGGAESQQQDGRLGEGQRVEGLGEEASVGPSREFKDAAIIAFKHKVAASSAPFT